MGTTKMKKTPNAFQKMIHRFLMLDPVSAFLAISLYRLDTLVLKVSKGKHTIAEIVGLPMIQITTTGAKTGEPRTMPLVSLFDGEKIALIGSNFGRKANPGWYYNLKAHPQCTALVNGCLQNYLARETQGEERQRYWSMAVLVYKGYELYAIRAAHRQIPVMILEPAK
jgi:deazaflavin-dependent oxidoreductase (nitroreductase family)